MQLFPSLLPGFVAAAGLFSSVAAAPVVGTSCVNAASNLATFSDFKIECGIDHSGRDVSSTYSPSFESCILSCKAFVGCDFVSFVGGDDGGNCYLKTDIGIGNIAGHVWSAKKIVTTTQPTTPAAVAISCANNKDNGTTYTSAAGKKYLVYCGWEYGGGDLASTSTTSFELCMDACATTTGCIDVSYVYGACYMKSVLNGDLVKADHVWSGIYLPAPVASSSTTSRASSTASSTSSAVASAAPLSCVNNLSNGKEFGSSTGGLYTISCGTDYAGGDLKRTVATTFEACISDCDATLGCVDVSYVAPDCYLKKEIGTASTVGYVWNAKVLKPARDIFAFPTATPQPIGHGTEVEMGGPYTFPAPPVATLGPQTPPGLDVAGLQVLAPDEVASLWYAGSHGADEEGSTTVQLTITYRHPSVVLEHSSHIKDVACTTSVLSGRFDASESFLFATAQWAPNDPTIFITHATGCNDDGQNVYFLAESITFDTDAKTFSATGAIVEIDAIFTEMEADFGHVSASDETPAAPSCGQPGQAVLNGLPAIGCGEDFDKNLDAQLGYYKTENSEMSTVLAAASPNVVYERGLSVRALEKRCSWWDVACKAREAWEAVQRAARALAERIAAEARRVAAEIAARVAAIARAAAEAAARAAAAIAASIKAAAEAAARIAAAAAAVLLRGEFSQSLSLNINLGPPASFMTESPWGPAMKLYTFKRGEADEKFSLEQNTLDNMLGELLGEADPEPGVEIYCHKCGIDGKVTATGSIKATILSGLTRGTISVTGNMYAGAYLGINAFAQWEKTVKKPLLVKGLPGWEIPKVISLGPRLILEAMATVSIEAEGQIYTGASLTWPRFEATLDFVDKSKSTKSGWTPVVDKAFEIHGSLEATAALGLPVTLNFGIDILSGRWSKGVNLTDTPAVTAHAEIEVDYTPDGGLVVGNDECAGISWDISLTNEVHLDIDEVGGWALAEWASPALASGCIGIKAPEPVSSSTTTTTTTTTRSSTTTTTTTTTRASTTTTTTTTAAPVPTVLTPTSANPVCTQDRYMDAAGVTYAVQCGYDYTGPNVEYYRAPSWAACVVHCSSWGPWCADARWLPSTSGQNCFIRQLATEKRADPNVNSLLKVGVAIITRDVPELEAPVAKRHEQAHAGSVSGGIHSRHGAFHRRTAHMARAINDTVATNSTASPSALANLISNGTASAVNATIIATNGTSKAVKIMDTTNTLVLNPGTNGNLFVGLADSTAGATSFVASTDTTTLSIWGDSSARWLHYYPSTLASTGVSRLRLADWETIPKGARLTTLVPFKAPTGEEMLVAIDADGSYAWPFMCGIKDQTNKVFLVRDVNTAAAILAGSTMKFTITGGQANNCVPLALKVVA